MKDFAAIDCETANNERTSVCSVGVVIVRDGEFVDSFSGDKSSRLLRACHWWRTTALSMKAA